MAYLKLALLVLVFAATIYLIRGNRAIGSKLSAYQQENRKSFKEIAAQMHRSEDALQLLT